MLSKNLEQRNDSIQNYNQKGPFQPILVTFCRTRQNDFLAYMFLETHKETILWDTGALKRVHNCMGLTTERRKNIFKFINWGVFVYWTNWTNFEKIYWGEGRVSTHIQTPGPWPCRQVNKMNCKMQHYLKVEKPKNMFVRRKHGNNRGKGHYRYDK